MAEKPYTGTENLEVMSQAVNYNNYLINEIKKYAPKKGTLVDFGAGTGSFSKIMKKQGFKVICVEPDKELFDRLKKDKFEVYRSVAQMKPASQDFVYALNVFEHIKDDVKALKELQRVIKPGGAIFVYLPAFPILFSSMDKLVGHYRRYKTRELESKLRKSGFKVVSNRYADSVGFFVALVYKLIGDRQGALNPKTVKFYDRFLFPINRLTDKLASRLFGKNVVAVARKV